MMMPANTHRRTFMLRLAGAAASVSLASGLTGCWDSEEPEFLYGVASGDPLADRVILWTHAKFPSGNGDVSLRYEVARDKAFNQVVASGDARATASTGHTVKVDATGLSAGNTYYFRFRFGDVLSPVGQTRTLPASTATSVSMAVMSCANYPAGRFHVYAEAARSQAQYAVHLGDYLYEYAANGYASGSAEALGRVSDPSHEILTLADYRLRHAQYKSDPDSKTLHAAMPMIAVWDDHEIANDAFKDGAENHDSATEGAWAARREAALQAYHEWMPIRTGADRSKIWRSFDFGSLASLHMLDTRLFGRDEQIDIAEMAGLAGGDAQAAALAEFSRADRQMLGAEQLQWLQTQMASSTATWQVLGQQVLMGRMEFPASVLAALNSSDTSPEAQQAGMLAIGNYLAAKGKSDEQRSDAEKALMNTSLNPKLGYNLDAWDGYIVARETLLGTALQLQKRLVVLAGDTHNAWHSDLTLMGLANAQLAGMKVGEEFATSSVSSPGLETYLATLTPTQIEQIFTGVVDDLNWMDASRRGFLTMTFTASEAKGVWTFVDNISQATYTATVGHEATYSFNI
jgi:alkaline phosphatase D